jgi:hypothetical protein
MKRGRWFFAILPILLLCALGGLAVGEGTAPGGSGPEAVAPQSAAPGQLAPGTAQPEAATVSQALDAQAPTPAEPEQAAVESEAAPSEEQALVPARAPSAIPSAPPPSLQTLVDERRDLLRKRREAMFDAYGGRYAYMPPWMAGYDSAVEQYRDAMRRLYRQQRDYSRMRHNSWMDALCPWSKPQRDWSEQRSYVTQMDQLDRQEYWNNYLYGQPFAAGGPIPW